jgi:hypothetical protein
MTDREKEFLIELVRVRPVLYNKLDGNFKDVRTIKKNNWDDVASEMKEFPESCADISGDSASVMWTNIRDIFMSNKRNYEVCCKSGSPAVSEPKWKFWNLLKWLLDFNKKQISCSNVVQPSARGNLPTPTPADVQSKNNSLTPATRPDEAKETAIASISNPPKQQTNTSSVTAINLDSDTPTSSNQAKKRKTAKDSRPSTSTAVDTIDKEIEFIKQSIAAEESQDDMHVYAMSVAAKLRGMSGYQAAVARRGIENLLFDIQYTCPREPPMAYPQSTNIPRLPVQQFSANAVMMPFPPLASNGQEISTDYVPNEL